MGNKDTLLIPGEEGVNIRFVDILASKVNKPAGGAGLNKGLQFGLTALLKAKESQVDAVKKFLIVCALPISFACP